jgi:arylsulfatase B
MVLDIDFMPTLIDLCGLPTPAGVDFDGISVAGLLDGSATGLPERVHFLQIRQSTAPPERWTNAVMTPRWRLVFGRELYDIKADPGQTRDVAEDHPTVVARLRAAHEAWWEKVTPLFDQVCPISLGNAAENPTTLCAMDVMGDVAWNQQHILAAQKSTGRWAVDVEQPGRYTFRLRRWPPERELGISDRVPDAEAATMAPYCGRFIPAEGIHPVKARLGLFDTEHAAAVPQDAQQVCFTLDLDRTGPTTLEAWFADETGEERGAYYVVVERGV